MQRSNKKNQSSLIASGRQGNFFLVLSPGEESVRPPLPGIDLPGIFHLRTVTDAHAIIE
jgi:hypothetical protein